MKVTIELEVNEAQSIEQVKVNGKVLESFMDDQDDSKNLWMISDAAFDDPNIGEEIVLYQNLI